VLLRTFSPVLYLTAFVWRRMLFRTTFIALTGSLGKTTAKESLAHILRLRYRTFHSRREQNSGYLTSLNVLRVRPWHRVAIFEVATARPGQLKPLSRLLRPDIAVLLRVARTHTKNYRSLADIAQEKWQVIAGIEKRGTVFINGDDPWLLQKELPAGIRRVTFGCSDSCDFVATEVKAAWPDRLSLTVHHGASMARAETRLVGAHWVTSVLAAIAVSAELGIDLQQAARAVGGVAAFPARMQPVVLPSGAVVIRDEYNGTVDSFGAAFRFLAEATAPRRILIATGYTDTKEQSTRRMRNVGREAATICDLALFFGRSASTAVRAARQSGMPEDKAKEFYSLPLLADYLRQELKAGDLVLVKGRTTDHLSRAILAQFGEIRCWEMNCRRTHTCDFCWKLGLSSERLEEIVYS